MHARRPALHPPGHEPAGERRVIHSRTRAGPTTMTYRNRVIATVLIGAVFVFGLFTPLLLSFLIGYPVLAGVLLRSIWKEEAFSVIDDGSLQDNIAPQTTERRSTPPSARIGAVVISIALAVLLLGFLWNFARSLVVLAFFVGLAVVVTAWFSDIT
jgi:hypothetical protein